MRIISGIHKGRPLKTLKGSETRPTMGKVKEAVFSSIQNLIHGSIWLDLFAGNGSIGLEALSRGAKFCYFVEKNPLAYKTIGENVKLLGLQNSCQVICGDATKLGGVEATIDIVYIDPPYFDQAAYLQVLDKVKAVTPQLVIVEHSPQLVLDCPDYNLLRTRKYGSSAVSFYEFGE